MATSLITMPSSLSFFISSIFSSSSSSSSSPNQSLTNNFLSFKPLKPQLLKSAAAGTATLAPSVPSTLPILDFDGSKVGETILNIKSAPPDTARAVVHRGITTDLTNKRRGTASTLTRGEVRGGGIKPYPQKKTGRARRGSSRTPLRPGGGVVFGPKPKDWSIKINKKEKKLAISTALASAAVNGIVVEEFGDKFEKPKTKDFIEALKRWGIDRKEKSMFLMTELSDNVVLSSRNIGTLRMLTPRTLNLFDILNADKLVFTQSALDYLNKTYGYNAAGDQDGEEEEDDLFEGGENEGEAADEGTETEEQAAAPSDE